MGFMYIGICLTAVLLVAVAVMVRWHGKREDSTYGQIGKSDARPVSFGYSACAWAVLIIASVILLLAMYADMPYTGRSGLLFRGVLIELALPAAVLSLVWLMFSGPVLPEYAKIRRYGKYAFMGIAFFMMMGISLSSPLGGVEDLFSGTVTEDMMLHQIMYEKVQARGSGKYSFLFPEKSDGKFELMMESGRGYAHFYISPSEKTLLYPLADGIKIGGTPISLDDLMQAAEEGTRSFAMYQSEQMNDGEEIVCSVTYYPRSGILASIKGREEKKS